MNSRVRSFASFAFACAVVIAVDSSAPRLRAADDILARSRAIYAGLRSYADTGTVLHEYGTGSKDRHTFATYLNRTPRRFYFDFKKELGDRVVVWGDPDAFHSWWKATGSRSDYPNPDNLGAFTTTGFTTSGVVIKIPLLWYPKAALQGPFTNFADVVLEGTDVVGGHQCHRLVGVTRDIYGATGRESNVRRMTVWIDTESLLIRKIFEKPKESLPGHIDGDTTTYEPQANPTIDEAKFRFVPPTPK